MKPENLKLMLDKIVSYVPDESNDKGIYRFREVIRKDIKDFTIAALEGMKKEVEAYGYNTHSASAVQAFLIEFRRIV